MRSLVVAKVDNATNAASNDESADTAANTTKDDSISTIPGTTTEIRFSSKVEYLGTNAQSIAFLKREDYAKLELSSEMSLDNVLDAAMNSESSEAGAT